MSWLCSCGLVNSGLNTECVGLKAGVKDAHVQVSENSPDWVMSYVSSKGLDMTEQEELFTQFYNHEKLLVKGMDLIELREHRRQLAKIALEAKARVVAADDDMRERNAKTNTKEWLTTDTRPTYDVVSAVNVPALRKARMSKMDKLRADLVKAGLDDKTINEMIGKLEKNAPDNKLKTITFSKPSTELKAIQVKRDTSATLKPFDPGKLKFEPKK